MRAGTFFLSAAVTMSACAGSSDTATDSADSGAWVGTSTTDGTLTTVVNESGSLWGGNARLVEESSIGLELGPEEYLLGAVAAVWATDERTFVADRQVPIVRVYDASGQHLFDVGGEGQGPGEYTGLGGLGLTPGGDIVVSEHNGRLSFFAADGTPKQTFNSGAGWSIFGTNLLQIDTEGMPWVVTIDLEQVRRDGSVRMGMQAVGPEGRVGDPVYPVEPDFDRWCLEYRDPEGDTDEYCGVPFAPSITSAFAPSHAWVAGTTDRYRFEVRGPGDEILAVERSVVPVPISADEADYYRRQTAGEMRRRQPGWTWDGPDVPDHKPAYDVVVADRDGRYWVARQGPSRRRTGCTEDFTDYAEAMRNYISCWPAPRYFDAFDEQGRFLGSVPLPDAGLSVRNAFIGGGLLVFSATDEAGTVMVKRYRLMLP